MEVYILLSISNILCFLIGAIVGQRALIQKPIIKEPTKAIEEHFAKKEKKEYDEYFKTMAENIDNYNGTSMGQKKLGG